MNIGQIVALMAGGGFTFLAFFAKHFLDKKKEKTNEGKTVADTLKSLADVYNIKAGAEIQIAQQWQKLADELRRELEKERMECDSKMQKMQEKIDNLKQEVEKLKNKNNERV